MRKHFLSRKTRIPLQCVFVVLVCLFNESSFRAKAQTPTPIPQTFNTSYPPLPQDIHKSDFVGGNNTTFDSIPFADSASVTVEVDLNDLASPEKLVIALFPGCPDEFTSRLPENVPQFLIWDHELLVDDAGQPIRHIVATAVLPTSILNKTDITGLCLFSEELFLYTAEVLHEEYGTDSSVVGMFNSCSLTINPVNPGHIAPPTVNLFGGTEGEPFPAEIDFGQPLTFVATASGNPSSYSIDRLGIVVTDLQSCQDMTCGQQPPPPPPCQTYKSSEIFQPSSADPAPVLTYLPPTLMPNEYEIVARAIDSAGYSQTITKNLTVKRLFGLFSVLNLSCSIDGDEVTTFSGTLHLQNDTAVDSSELRVRLLEVASTSVIFVDGPLPTPPPTTPVGAMVGPVSPLPAGAMEDVSISGTVQAPLPWEGPPFPMGQDWFNYHVYAMLDEFVDGQWITVDTLKVIDGVQKVASGFGGPGSGTNDPPGSVPPGYDPMVLDSVAITGPGSVNEGTEGAYTATATTKNSTGSKTLTVVPLWSVSQFSIDNTGHFQPGDVNSNTTVNITATYTLGGVTKTATKSVTVISDSAHLGNLSTRLRVLTGENVLIGGLIISGTDQKRILLRALGPSLGDLGITNPLLDPVLELRDGDSSLITSNDNWQASPQAGDIEATGLAPSSALESAILATLDPGLYTATVNGKNGATGVGLIETYDLDETADSKFGNISTRGFVDTDDNVLIGGFIVENDSIPIVARALGPSLSNFGVTQALQDPVLQVFDNYGTLLSSNDNWKDTQQTEITATGLMPKDDRESAILMTFAPGAYTTIVRGQNNTTGVGLVEIYQLP